PIISHYYWGVKQSGLPSRLTYFTKNTFFGVKPLVPLMEEREWDTLGCAGFLGISLLTLFSFRHHNNEQ
ncbi:hypothetical protein CKK01_24035, partial [Acinetobacter baumannii]|nr:hypothetical protein [Acinetobacter baumannii]